MKRRIEAFAKRIETLSREHTWLKFALTDTNLEEGTFKGVASVFGSIVNAWYPTVILPGAFTKTLKENAANVKLLHQHDTREPIGVPTRLQETQTGLEVEGKISQTTRGKDDLILVRDGVVDELSIGFDPIEGKTEMLPLSKCIELQYVKNPTQWSKMDEKEMIRCLREVRLWEISLVTWAADPMAKIQSVHSMVQPVLGASLDDFASALLETHEGKVLSAKNKKLLNDCMAALQALIAAAEPPEDDDASKQGTSKQALTVNAERSSQLREAELAFALLQHSISQ